MKEHHFCEAARRRLDDAIRAARAATSLEPRAQDAYDRLVSYVRGRTGLLRPAADPGRLARCTEVNSGLLALALHRDDWLRSVERWEPPPGSATVQFASLAAHLLTRYPVPPCLNAAWFQAPAHRRHPEQAWYKHLGRGDSLRTAGLPLPFTRAMAHHFSEAPAYYTPRRALRWAQVRGLGGSEHLASVVVQTRLGSEFANEDFWVTVLRFFVANPRMDLTRVGRIVDFLHDQRCVTREVFVPGQGVVRQGPPQPDFSLKGRSVASLWRQVEEWEGHRGQSRWWVPSWAPTAIRGFRHVEEDGQRRGVRCWTIRELLTGWELECEGQAMRHCVATYEDDCASRATSIWSLRLDRGHGPRRALTVEVDPKERVICQARGYCDREPREAELALLQLWARREGLTIDEHL